MSTILCECGLPGCGRRAVRYNDAQGNDVGFWSEACAKQRGFVLADDMFDMGRRVNPAWLAAARADLAIEE